MTPTSPHEREPILDALRGFAVLGILLVNMEVMRGPDWIALFSDGTVSPAGSLAERIAQFAIGWLGTGKFVSSLAILFGVGAGLIAGRSPVVSPRALLARRYVCLMGFGIAHMLLLYPGDILFMYGITGFTLLPFVTLHGRSLLLWSGAIMTAYTVLGLSYLWSTTEAQAAGTTESPAAVITTLAGEQRAEALSAFISGSYGDVIGVHAWQAPMLQIGQLYAWPWLLAFFIFGLAIARAGVATNPAAHRNLLTYGAWIGLGIGLPANLVLGWFGPLVGFSAAPWSETSWILRWTGLAQVLGEPILAVGYLCALSLLWLRRGVPRALVAVGRMALTAYLVQSALALAVMHGLKLYDRLTTASALIVILGIWGVLLLACPLWLRAFQMGPVEWLWRSLTYGRVRLTS